MAKKRFSPPKGDKKESTPKTKEVEWKIENVVATVVARLEGDEKKIDLNKIARKYADTEYNPERFPGLVMRVADPKATILLFSTGKMVITGLRQASDAPVVASHAIALLEKARINVAKDPEVTIQNIVASGDLHVRVNLNEAAIIMENTMYEPEVFPGLIHRVQGPRAVFLIFSTGRIVCTGAKTKEIVGEAIAKLAADMRARGVTIEPGDDFKPEYNFS